MLEDRKYKLWQTTAYAVLLIVAVLLPVGARAELKEINTQKWGMRLEYEERTVNYSGTCGTAKVNINAITDFSEVGDIGGPNVHFSLSGGNIEITNTVNGKYKTITHQPSDHNMFACLKAKPGQVLVINSNCGGSACGDEGTYTIIDVTKMVRLTDEPKKNLCGDECANKILGIGVREYLEKGAGTVVPNGSKTQSAGPPATNMSSIERTAALKPWFLMSPRDKICVDPGQYFNGSNNPDAIAKLLTGGPSSYFVKYNGTPADAAHSDVATLRDRNGVGAIFAMVRGRKECEIALKLTGG